MLQTPLRCSPHCSYHRHPHSRRHRTQALDIVHRRHTSPHYQPRCSLHCSYHKHRYNRHRRTLFQDKSRHLHMKNRTQKLSNLHCSCHTHRQSHHRKTQKGLEPHHRHRLSCSDRLGCTAIPIINGIPIIAVLAGLDDTISTDARTVFIMSQTHIPDGQQPSPSLQALSQSNWQAASQESAAPIKESAVHESPSKHDERQSPSQKARRLQQRRYRRGAQSLSSLALQPGAQHPSSF